MKRCLAILFLLCCFGARADEVIPPAPDKYFNDYAHVTSAATANRLNQQLEDFEKQTSSQIVVAVFPKMQSDSSIEDYTVRVARAWKEGRKGKDNAVVLFVFTQEHKLYIQVGYGLEGALPDALAKRIIDDEIVPRLRQGDYDGGLSAGVAAMMAAAKGEYKGTGQTVNGARRQSQNNHSNFGLIIPIVVVILILSSFGRRRRYGSGWMLGSGGFGGWGNWGGGGGGWSGGGGGGGFTGGGGGGGLTGGGGSFGGGGAGGSW